MANIYLMFNARRSVSKHLSLADLSDNEVLQMTRFPRHAVSELCKMMEDELSRKIPEHSSVTRLTRRNSAVGRSAVLC